MPCAARPFLARPAWRDYVVAYVLIGVGVMLIDVAATDHGHARPWIAGIAFTVFGTGWLVFACAIGGSIAASSRSLWRMRSHEARLDSTGRCATCGRTATIHLTEVAGHRKLSRSFCTDHVPSEYRERLALQSPAEQIALLRTKLAQLDEHVADARERAEIRARLLQLMADLEAGRRGMFDTDQP